MLRLFLNFGHTLDHLLMLIFPTVVLAIGVEYGQPYSELLPLALGGFIAFGACSLPAGWLADRWSRGARRAQPSHSPVPARLPARCRAATAAQNLARTGG